MKFQNFEALYGAACEIFAAAGENPAVAAAVAKQKRFCWLSLPPIFLRRWPMPKLIRNLTLCSL